MFENDSLKIQFISPNIYHFSGRIDENFPPYLAPQMDQSLLHFNFHELAYMNSMGIVRFITLLNSLPPSVTLYYEAVPAIVVGQMGLVKGIINHRFKMKSFYVPYLDKESDEQFMILVKIEEVINQRLPDKPHPLSGKPLEPDVHVDRFLKFMSHY